jgi:uncharacterized membrane protein YgdD (TMEM256/DUF423 family)
MEVRFLLSAFLRRKRRLTALFLTFSPALSSHTPPRHLLHRPVPLLFGSPPSTSLSVCSFSCSPSSSSCQPSTISCFPSTPAVGLLAISQHPVYSKRLAVPLIIAGTTLFSGSIFALLLFKQQCVQLLPSFSPFSAMSDGWLMPNVSAAQNGRLQ